jgi:hypothetical protein
MLTYSASIPLSSRTLCWLSDQIRTHRQTIGSRWRKLDPAGQALLVLAHLRNGDTHARLAAGYQLGVTTVWRYITETIDLIADQMPTLQRLMGELARLVWVILDGTLIPIDRIADQKPYYNGHKRRHGVNAQFLSDARGRLRWVSPALPGATHDTAAARHHHIPELLTRHGAATLADKGYQGAGPTIATPFKRSRRLSANQKAANRSLSRARALGERAAATLKCWKILTKLRCCPTRATPILAAITVLQHTEENRPLPG